jgi:hypothetical protein
MDSRRTLRTALLALPLLAAVPVSGAAQTNGSGAGVGQILMGMRNGGGWVGIPIEDGKGTFSTVTLPTAAMSVAGCVNVWWGHSGTFEIQAHERVLGSNLRIEAEPGIGVPFGLRVHVERATRHHAHALGRPGSDARLARASVRA